MLVRRRCSTPLRAGPGWFECPRPPRHATRRLRALDDSVSLAVDSPLLPEGSRKPTRHSALHPDGRFTEPPTRSPEGSPRRWRPASHASVVATRDSDPPGSLVWVGLRPNRHRPHRETARTEILSVTRRPSSRRKRRGRGWITHALVRGLSPWTVRHQPPKRSCREQTEVSSQAPRAEARCASISHPPKRIGNPRVPAFTGSG